MTAELSTAHSELPEVSEVRTVEPVGIFEPLDRPEAERLDKRLRLMAGTARENLEKIGRLLDDAKRGQIHEALGFPSWTAYVADALGGTLQLSDESRRGMVQLMAAKGMSERAISQMTGVPKTTVHRDISEVVHNGPAESDTAAEPPEPTPATVMGLDGKTHPKSKPVPRPRPSRFRGFTHDLTPIRKALRQVPEQVARFDQLADDDQFRGWFGEVESRVTDVRREIAKAIQQLQRMDERVQQVASGLRNINHRSNCETDSAPNTNGHTGSNGGAV